MTKFSASTVQRKYPERVVEMSNEIFKIFFNLEVHRLKVLTRFNIILNIIFFLCYIKYVRVEKLNINFFIRTTIISLKLKTITMNSRIPSIYQKVLDSNYKRSYLEIEKKKEFHHNKTTNFKINEIHLI